MSIVTLVSRTPQRLLGPEGKEGLLLDAVIEEAITLENDYTMHPIELAGDITDHIIPKPTIYTMNGVVSDHPMKWFTTTYGEGFFGSRHQAAYGLLRDLWASRQVFDIETGYKKIENVVLTSVTTSKNAATAHTLNFEATLVQVTIVATRETKASPAQVQKGTHAEQVDAAEAGGTTTGVQTTALNDLASPILDKVKSFLDPILGFF